MGGNSYAFFALKTDGTLWAWGSDEEGTMAQSTVNVNKSSPTQIGALTTWASLLPGGTNGGGGAIKTDGTLWMWGPNYDGNLGTNNTVYYSSPVQVGSDTDWSLGSSGYSTTAAIKTNGTLWIWGGNSRGQLGQSDVREPLLAYSSRKSYGVDAS
jgi:alpha-tubulin suppressor-like RCC1 family protein